MFASAESLDQYWYEKFRKVGTFQAYEYLDGSKTYREKQKQAFLDGVIENPSFDYPEIKGALLSEKEKALLTLKKEIFQEEENRTIRQAYLWKIDEKLAEIHLLQAVQGEDMSRFKSESELLYGKPSIEIFHYTVNQIKEVVRRHLKSEKIELRDASSRLRATLPLMSQSPEFIKPNSNVFQDIKKEILREFQPILDVIDKNRKVKYDHQEIKSVFENALRKIDAFGWRILIAENSKVTISVNQEQKVIIIPEGRRAFGKQIERLLLHEIITHALRQKNGAKSKLRLLALGLDHYEKGEEGIATLREQALASRFYDFSGLDGYLAVSLAYGLDGTPRDFRKTFTFLEKYYLMLGLTGSRPFGAALSMARESAWNRCVRTFRGTDCKSPGVCFTKDIIYREGNIAMWDALLKDEATAANWNMGKYDPSNPHHLRMLEDLGILEKNKPSR